jgi:hypothetical protein
MMRRRLAGVVLAGAMLAGCAGQPAAEPTQAPPSGAAADPLALIGLWRIEEPSEQPDAVVRLAAHEFGVFRRCESLTGEWNADQSGSFVASTGGFSPDDGEPGCQASWAPDATALMPSWLPRVVGFRVDGADRLLLDAEGEVVARLRPGARSISLPSKMAPELTDLPVVDAAARDAFAPAAALAAHLEPATTATLTGRWLPVGWKPRPNGTPSAEFRANGDWHGSDGCNGQGGRWAAGAQGAFIATMGPQTLIGCAGVSVGSWLSQARRAGFDQDALVLLDAAGKELGRLQRER